MGGGVAVRLRSTEEAPELDDYARAVTQPVRKDRALRGATVYVEPGRGLVDDVVDLRRASPLLKFSVAAHGKVLYERAPGVHAEFYSLAFRMYCDTKKLRDATAESIGLYLNTRGRR